MDGQDSQDLARDGKGLEGKQRATHWSWAKPSKQLDCPGVVGASSGATVLVVFRSTPLLNTQHHAFKRHNPHVHTTIRLERLGKISTIAGAIVAEASGLQAKLGDQEVSATKPGCSEFYADLDVYPGIQFGSFS